MTFGIAVSYDHRDVASYALGAQSGLGKAGSHREEIDYARILGAENAGHFGIGNIDVIDGNIAHFSVGKFGNFSITGTGWVASAENT